MHITEFLEQEKQNTYGTLIESTPISLGPDVIIDRIIFSFMTIIFRLYLYVSFFFLVNIGDRERGMGRGLQYGELNCQQQSGSSNSQPTEILKFFTYLFYSIAYKYCHIILVFFYILF